MGDTDFRELIEGKIGPVEYVRRIEEQVAARRVRPPIPMSDRKGAGPGDVAFERVVEERDSAQRVVADLARELEYIDCCLRDVDPDNDQPKTVRVDTARARAVKPSPALSTSSAPSMPQPTTITAMTKNSASVCRNSLTT